MATWHKHSGKACGRQIQLNGLGEKQETLGLISLWVDMEFDPECWTPSAAVVEKPHPLSGQEVRFLRKYLGMNGATFASHLGVDRAVVSRWENGHDRIGPQSDRLIRTVATSLGGLKTQVEQVVRKFAMIDNDPKTGRIEINVEKLSFEYA